MCVLASGAEFMVGLSKQKAKHKKIRGAGRLPRPLPGHQAFCLDSIFLRDG